MINPRLLIQIPLFLIGSCAPITPNIDITVITSQPPEEIAREKLRLAKTGEFEKAMAAVDTKTCQGLSKVLIEEYKYPNDPDLSGIDPDDHEALVNALMEHIKVLRGEIGSIVTKAKCEKSKD